MVNWHVQRLTPISFPLAAPDGVGLAHSTLSFQPDRTRMGYVLRKLYVQRAPAGYIADLAGLPLVVDHPTPETLRGPSAEGCGRRELSIRNAAQAKQRMAAIHCPRD